MTVTTMKAVRIHEFGDASVLRYEDTPRPSAGPGEVLIRTVAASHNPSDIGFRAGFMQHFVPVELPYGLGSDVSGTVVELGQDVDTVVLGHRVIGRVDGAMAEYGWSMKVF